MYIHHFGIVVPCLQSYLDETGFWTLQSSIIDDPLQDCRLCLVNVPTANSTPYIEIIEPLSKNSPVKSFCDNGGGLHHMCFSFSSFSDADIFWQDLRLLPVTEWVPAALFNDQPVRFGYCKSMGLVELLCEKAIDCWDK
jgi:hypothetical protein